jgi:hypothetical protein
VVDPRNGQHHRRISRSIPRRALSEGSRKTLADAVALSVENAATFDVVLVDCPVCGSPAEGSGDIIDDGEVDIDWNPDGTNYTWAYDFHTILDQLNCSVCGLLLEGVDELAEAGVARQVQNVRANDSPDFHASFFEP